jgi:hypothetical protein
MWEFDVATGQSYFDPKGTRVRAYDVDIESGRSLPPALRSDVGAGGLVEGPYVAEVFPVTVEDEYVVIMM